MKLKKYIARYTSYILNRPLIRNIIPEKYFLKQRFYYYNDRKLNLKNPVYYNDKLQWLKLYYKKKDYSKLADKYLVRKFIENKIGGEYLIPLIGGPYYSFDEIDFSRLPDQFVIKTTHDSGGVYICKDKNTIDLVDAKSFINEHLRTKFYWIGREYPYRDLTPSIIIEKYMVDESENELKDYKIFCFNGVPKVIQVDFGRFTNHKRNFYDVEWNLLSFGTNIYKNDPSFMIHPPKILDKLLQIASTLSQNMLHVRVDLYNVNDKVYFGEMTFFHGSGFEKFTSEKWERQMGEWLILPNI